MADAAKLIAVVEANTRAFENAMRRVQGTADNAFKGAERSSRRLDVAMNRNAATANKLRTALASFGSAIPAIGIASVAAGVKRVIDNMADLADNAKRAGVSVENFQKLVFAARQEGGSEEGLVTAFAKLNVELGKVEEKGSALGRIFRDNNVSLAAIKGDPVQALLTIADLMKNAATSTDRATIGAAALGRGYKDLVPFLEQGAGAIQEQMNRLEALGGVASGETVAAFKRVNDEITAIADIAMPKLAQGLLPTLAEVEAIIGAAGRLQAALENALPSWARSGDLLGSLSTALGATAIHDKLFGPTPVEQTVNTSAKSDRAPTTIVKPLSALEPAAKKTAAAVHTAKRAIDDYNTSSSKMQMMDSADADAQARLQDEIDATKATTERLAQAKDDLRQLAGDDIISAFDRLALGGEKLTAVLADLAKELALAGLRSALLGQGPLAGILGTQNAGGGVGGLLANLFHSGGVVGSPGPSRAVPAAAFAGAPRYHSGNYGMGAGEVPAILKRGELVIPKVTRGGGMRGGTINIGGPTLNIGTMEDRTLAKTKMMIDAAQAKQRRELQRNFGSFGGSYQALRG